MKANMSGLDLRAIVGELSQYVGAYVKKSYMPHYEQIVLRINPKESSQFDLVIVRVSVCRCCSASTGVRCGERIRSS